jgi:hypothetical protein
MKVFSVNGAAELLEKDRRTLQRAMRGVKPDAYEGRNPRWRMRSFVDALERSSERHDDDRGQRADLNTLYERFDAAFDEMTAEPSLAKRRLTALELGPLIAQIDRMQRGVSAADGEPELLVQLRADKIFMLLPRGFEGPCEWSRDETWNKLAGME